MRACTLLSETHASKRTVGIFSSCLLLLNNSVELRSGGWSFHPCEDVYVRASVSLCARARREWPISIAVVLEGNWPVSACIDL